MFNRRDAYNTEASTRDATAHTAAPAQSTESLLAQEDTFEGEIKTSTGVRVLGTVRGTIDSQKYVRIESGATVEADIMAEEVVVAGTFSGSLLCRTRLEITSTGQVTGKVDTKKLHLHEGGFFDGELHMERPGETPRAASGDEGRPRRSRYVDLASESAKPANEATEASSTPETAP